MNTRKCCNPVRPLARLAAAGAVLTLLQVASPVVLQEMGYQGSLGQAAAEEKKKSTEKTRKTPAISAKIYKKLEKAQEYSEAEQFNDALKVLNDIKANSGKMNGYEKATMWNFYSFVYYSQENYKKVLEAYRNVLAQSPDIPLQMEYQTKYQMGQLYFVTEDYKRAISTLEDWFRVDPMAKDNANARVLLAQGYYQTKKYDKALSQIEEAMRITRAKGKEAKENWYLLMRVLYYEKGDMKKVAWVLEELTRRWPKKDYLVQLSGIYSELNNEKRQLIALEAAYTANMLAKQQDLLNMAYLFLGADVPYKAAKVLDKGLKEKKIEATAKNYEVLGTAYRAAQEVDKAIPVMEKAAQLSPKGENWARLANVYLDDDQYGKAADAARKAIKKGGIKRKDNTQVVLGMALFNQNKLTEARKVFESITDKRSSKMREQWLKYLDTEIGRRASLQEDMG
ncbi:tetratricopeptide repeat protein [Sinobacterium caligoides]|uniref:Tetratricopeptide repeat protein n=1 Tax=Sinobacterium caligoides TaxID=933926 RepID=A0A3N2DGR2_9GAMM|nr:tetratricopeptide repeat protein [Sinobacterium caligoides]ROR98838.1 tetratricopeptide repeat protein [Sinobacterium caligoides]